MVNPDEYINKAVNKTSGEINEYVHWKDIDHQYKQESY